NLIIIPDGEPAAIVHALDVISSKNSCNSCNSWLKILKNPSLSKLDAQYYASIENIIAAYQSKDAVNEATLKKFGALWERNSRKNKAIIEGLLQGIDTLAQTIRPEIQAKNLPFVLLAAGPSLDTIADKMHALAERAVIIAVDTALNFLRQTGVSAHFVLACDGQFWNSKHLERADLSKSILVVEPTVYPSVMRLNAKAIYLSAGEKEKLGQGGSVATSSWDLARLLGAKEIYIAGLDLAYPGYKTHYKAAVFEKMALRSGSRLSPLETKSFQALRGGQPYYATASYTDVVGNNTPGKGKVLTDKRLSLYAAWFENAFSAYPEIKNYSLTQGGLAIAGLEYMDVDAFLAQNNIRVGEADSCVFVVN
ncbi:MAG: DUF115 domain-containing protein, partial [Spirochaetaceae bacterium]|nr:DUF115 domain-containing protein [Spirochaetaceae bacterium]